MKRSNFRCSYSVITLKLIYPDAGKAYTEHGKARGCVKLPKNRRHGDGHAHCKRDGF